MMRFLILPAILGAVLPAGLLGGERQVEKWQGIQCFVTRDVKQPGKPITELDFIGCDLKDADLKKLAEVRISLRSLNLRYNLKLTDASLKELACLERLEKLYLPVTSFGDSGLKALAALKNLNALSLMGTRVTDEGLKELAVHAKLRYLDVSMTKVTDAGVQMLQKALPKCEIWR